jgi:uncharacterized protein (DUF1330 family)
LNRKVLNVMSSYAVAILKDVVMGDDLIEYLRRIDGTLAPFGGHFVIHGGQPDVREGQWNGDLIIVGFPERDGARQWYESGSYQAIAPLRINNSTGTVAIFEGVDADHRATDILVG